MSSKNKSSGSPKNTLKKMVGYEKALPNTKDILKKGFTPPPPIKKIGGKRSK